MIQLTDILEQLHCRNPPVIHRDVKPSNIILHYDNAKYAERPKVYLIDFGAVANPQVQDGGSTVTGTYGYMAPEQLIGKPVSASDLYSSAVTAVYLLSGVRPENLEVQNLRLIIDPHLEAYPHVITVLLRHMPETDVTVRLCDYGVIRRAWNDFLHQKFDAEFEAGRRRSGDNNSLRSIARLGETGSIELQERLDDSKNRTVPWTHRKMIIRDAWHQTWSKSARTKFGDADSSDSVGFTMTPILIIVICAVCFVFYRMISTGVSEINMNVFGGLVIFILMVALMINMIYSAHKIGHVLKYGRKTLAAIVSVTIESTGDNEKFYQDYIYILKQYASLPHLMREKQRYLLDSMNKKLSANTLRWKVVYAFNPPDDESSEPLHHEYVSLESVSLQPGDVLPILYEIRKDKKIMPSMCAVCLIRFRQKNRFSSAGRYSQVAGKKEVIALSAGLFRQNSVMAECDLRDRG